MPVQLSKAAKKALLFVEKHDPKAAAKIMDKIEELENDSEPKDSERIRGIRQNYRRLRVGLYRVVYIAEDNLVFVRTLGPRKKVYAEFMRWLRANQ